MHVEFSSRSHIADPVSRTTNDDDLVDLFHDRWIALERFRQSGQWSQAQDRDRVGRGFDLICEQFFTAHDVLPLDRRKMDIAESIFTMQIPIVRHGGIVGVGTRTNARDPRRIEFFQQPYHVLGAPVRFDCSGASRHSNDVQPRIEKSQDQRDCIVNSWITINDNFSRHAGQKPIEGVNSYSSRNSIVVRDLAPFR